MTRASRKTRIGNFEALESKKLMTADMGMEFVDPAEAPIRPAIVDNSFSFGVEREMKESGEKGGTTDMNIGIGELQECTISKSMDAASPRHVQKDIILHASSDASPDNGGYDAEDYFTADSFSFGVEREMKESGEKGGTADMNIGVGELQECTVSKSMDAASGKLAQAAINGNSCGTAEIEFVEVGGGDLEGEAVDAVMQSMGSAGDADDRPTEEVAFYYNRN